MTLAGDCGRYGGMTSDHPLDCPIWNSLADRHAAFAVGDSLARRYPVEVSLFAASADDGEAAQAALLALIPVGGAVGRLDAAPPPPVAGTRVRSQVALNQMVLQDWSPPTARTALDWVDLGDADAAEMVALAALTKPGPFVAQTHRLGGFVGIRRAGQLVAMAGERLKPAPGFSEVSGVCTHPDWRGHGFGAALMGVVIDRILARGETTFLHCYPDNPAVALYKALGFSVRREIVYTILERAADPA